MLTNAFKNLDSTETFNTDTWNFKPSSSFHARCENFNNTDGYFEKKSATFDNTPAGKMVLSNNFCTLKLSEEP